jgi:hypothetical protein
MHSSMTERTREGTTRGRALQHATGATGSCAARCRTTRKVEDSHDHGHDGNGDIRTVARTETRRASSRTEETETDERRW